MQTRQEPTAPTHHHNDWQKWGGQHGNKICTLPAVTSDDQSCEDTQPAETNARAAVAQKTGHTMTVVTQVWPGGCCPACPVSFEETYGKHKPNTRFPERTSGYSDDAPWSGPKAGGGSMRCRKAGFCVFENASIHRLAARRTMTNVLTLTQVKLLTLERTQRCVCWIVSFQHCHFKRQKEKLQANKREAPNTCPQCPHPIQSEVRRNSPPARLAPLWHSPHQKVEQNKKSTSA